MTVTNVLEPDGTIEVISGRDWARVHPMLCPLCGVVFFGWIPLDVNPPEPYRCEADPTPAGRTRQTCGHPECVEAEDSRQWKRRQGNRYAHISHSTA